MSTLELADGAAFDARLGAVEIENVVLLGARARLRPPAPPACAVGARPCACAG
jgi:hypothetical protein